ncbi:MAG TPA: DNA alkylation repair protein [Bryobacteraceae bacterium]|nr:DNA alkylation repair protein [Bryobacteraceae bacterium]
MNAQQLAASLRRELQAAAEPEFAAGVRNFFREPVDPYGVRSSKLHAIARGVYSEVKGWPKRERDRFMTALWQSGKLEEGVIVCHVYRRFSNKFGETEFRMFDRWLDRYVRNWAHCDGLASWLVAGAIANRPQLIRRLRAWTKSGNRWRRRAAAVALLQEAKAGRNTAGIFEICTLLRDDPDDLVQKGVGWVLKETYPRRPHEVREFLSDWRATAPRLLLRIAAEKMTAKDRQWLLTK